MANCVGFHTQIASIMEVLANAAVAEICKLVDDDYAVLRLEVTQSQKENRTLRRKLQLLELKVAQERVLPSNVKILDRYRGIARGTFYRKLRLRGLSTPSRLRMCEFRCVNQNWVLVHFWIVCYNSTDLFCKDTIIFQPGYLLHLPLWHMEHNQSLYK